MLKKARLFRWLSYWPPFLGAGIHMTYVADDLSTIEVELRSYPWNRNYVGVHFGGSLYAMTDPFYMLMLIEHLGPQYIVWDKAATVRFKRPGRGRVRARFTLSREAIAEIRARADELEKVEPQFKVQVFDEANEVVAEVDKVLSVRRKDKARGPAAPKA